MFDSDQLIRIWESCDRRHSVDRSRYLVATAFPDLTWNEIDSMSLGRRDALLLEIHKRQFGQDLEAQVSCPKCREILEFAITLADISANPSSITGIQSLEHEDYQLQFRLPSSADICQIVGDKDIQSARQRLLQLCLTKIELSGQSIPCRDLPEDLAEKVANIMLDSDPQAEILIDLSCHACQYEWQAFLDIVEFIWIELKNKVLRVIGEVHRIAQAYSWSEKDILAMAPSRRRMYLELIDS